MIDQYTTINKDIMEPFNKENILIQFPTKHKDTIHIAIAFPNTYSLGMTSLGYQTAWKLLNQNEEIKATRWFTDTKEFCSRGSSRRTPTYIGFSLSW